MSIRIRCLPTSLTEIGGISLTDVVRENTLTSCPAGPISPSPQLSVGGMAMPFLARCPTCRQKMRFADSALGASQQCPRCHNYFTVAAEEQGASAPGAHPQATMGSWAA